MFFFWGGTLNVTYIFLGGVGGPQNVSWTLGTSSEWMFFFGGGGGVKNETRDLAGGNLHFTTPSLFNCVMSCFGWGGDPKCNLQFVTLVGMVCYILKA